VTGGDDGEIFRKEARERRTRQEGIDLPLGLSQMRQWITLLAAVLLAAALLLLHLLGAML
jgi:hypothetical protein